MTKKQKIWLGVFLAMFIIPEVLWSPVGNRLYANFFSGDKNSVSVFRPNFFTDVDNSNIISKVLFIQFLGLFLSAIYLLKIRKQFAKKYVPYFLAGILFVFSIVVFFVYGFSTMDNIGF